jgi:hypothetical protein
MHHILTPLTICSVFQPTRSTTWCAAPTTTSDIASRHRSSLLVCISFSSHPAKTSPRRPSNLSHVVWELKCLAQFKVMRAEHEAAAPGSVTLSTSDGRAHFSGFRQVATLSCRLSKSKSTTSCQQPYFAVLRPSSSVFLTSPSQRLHWRDLSQNTPPVAASREALAWPAS